MKRRAAGLALALAAAVLVLPGCGAMTPEKLAARVGQAVEKTPWSQLDMEMSMEASVTDAATGIEMDMTTRTSGQTRVSYDPDTVYQKLDFSIELMGMRVPAAMEIYVLPEGDQVACYTNMGDIWIRAEADASAQAAQGAFIAIWNLPAEQLSIDETVTQLEDAPALCLKGRVTGEQIRDVMNFLVTGLEAGSGQLDNGFVIGGESDTLEKIDWSNISAQVTTYVDPETFLPLREEITVEGMDQALQEILGVEGVSVHFKTTALTVDYTSYEPVEPCVLPEGARQSAEQGQRLLEGDPDNGDGTFTIQESGCYADIVAPDGYELWMTNYDEVDFYSEELDRLVCYQMWKTADSNDLSFWDMVSDEQYLYTDDIYGESRLEFQVVYTDHFGFGLDGYTYQGAYAGCNYYAWANLDDSFYNWVLVKIYDGGETMDTSITPEEVLQLLEQVRPHQSAGGEQGAGSVPAGQKL